MSVRGAAVMAATAALATLSQSLANAAPLESAGKLLVSALTSQTVQVQGLVEVAVVKTAPVLDADDPVEFVGLLPDYLENLASDGADHASLVESRGYVGRALFYLQQAPLA